MRTSLAIAMTLLLLSIVAVCPVLGCPLKSDAPQQASDCCHKSHHQEAPCPPESVRSCPYLLLERGNAAPVIAPVAIINFVADPVIALPAYTQERPASPTSTDSSGTYLRNRVLRI